MNEAVAASAGAPEDPRLSRYWALYRSAAEEWPRRLRRAILVACLAALLAVFADPARHYEALETAVRDASDFDVILIRQDPPFDMGYVSNTYLLELADPARTRVAAGCLRLPPGPRARRRP